jgi:hypothetical protein
LYFSTASIVTLAALTLARNGSGWFQRQPIPDKLRCVWVLFSVYAFSAS